MNAVKPYPCPIRPLPLFTQRRPGVFRGGAVVPAGHVEPCGADRGTDHRIPDGAANGAVDLQGGHPGGGVRGFADAVLGARRTLGGPGRHRPAAGHRHHAGGGWHGLAVPVADPVRAAGGVLLHRHRLHAAPSGHAGPVGPRRAGPAAAQFLADVAGAGGLGLLGTADRRPGDRPSGHPAGLRPADARSATVGRRPVCAAAPIEGGGFAAGRHEGSAAPPRDGTAGGAGAAPHPDGQHHPVGRLGHALVRGADLRCRHRPVSHHHRRHSRVLRGGNVHHPPGTAPDPAPGAVLDTGAGGHGHRRHRFHALSAVHRRWRPDRAVLHPGACAGLLPTEYAFIAAPAFAAGPRRRSRGVADGADQRLPGFPAADLRRAGCGHWRRPAVLGLFRGPDGWRLGQSQPPLESDRKP